LTEPAPSAVNRTSWTVSGKSAAGTDEHLPKRVKSRNGSLWWGQSEHQRPAGAPVGPSVMPSLKELFSSFIDSFFVFRVQQSCTVKDERIGAVFRGSQLLVVVYIFFRLWIGDTWAYSEVPRGVVNAWPEYGEWRSHADMADYADLDYCDSSHNSYAYDESFVMDNPSCEVLHPYEVTAKDRTRIMFVTAFIEIREVGWPVGDAVDGNETELCSARGGTVATSNSQRTCTSQRTVYPVGVDLMKVAFEHAFGPAQSDAQFYDLHGGSNLQEGQDGAVTSFLVAGNGSLLRTVQSGNAIRNTVEGWLEMANVSLNVANTKLTPDYRDATRYPPFRSAGVSIEVVIRYDNRNRDSRKAAYASRQVIADVSASAVTSVWAGNGPTTHYERYPTVDAATGAQHYDKYLKYRQGVVFTFRSTGLLFIMNWQYVFNTFVAGIVMLSVAKAIADAYALYLHPKGAIVRNFTRTTLEFSRRYAEIGLKAALAAQQFRALDASVLEGSETDNKIGIVDLCATYAHIEGVTFAQAYAIAHLVLESASEKTPAMIKARTKLKDMRQASRRARASVGVNTTSVGVTTSEDEQDVDPNSFDFGQFFYAREGGGMIPWSEFLVQSAADAAPLVANTSTETREECRIAFDKIKKKIGMTDPSEETRQESMFTA